MTGAIFGALALIFLVLIILVLRKNRASSGNGGVEAGEGCSPGLPDPALSASGVPDTGYPDEPTVDLDEASLVASVQQGPFLILPYVQLGEGGGKTLEIAFAVTADEAIENRRYQVVVDNPASRARVRLIARVPVSIAGLSRHYWYRFGIAGFVPGERLIYRVLEEGKCVFSAETRTPPAPGTDRYRVAVVGDMGTGRGQQMDVAFRIGEASPDLLAMTGDIVYRYGRAGEYLRRYFPVYNTTRKGEGAPLLRSVPHFTSAGNHCVAKPDMLDIPSFDVHPDIYAFYMYWSLPLNGPLSRGATVSTPHLVGSDERVRDFLAVAGDRFPVMTNYSFDYGNAHWLVLDANAYMDWTDERLKSWVDEDLARASGATWKFVNFHQPPFTSNLKHKREKRMRLLAEIFQKHGVDIVFSGHAHCYERTFPLKFHLQPGADGSLIDAHGAVHGSIEKDMLFDGVSNTRPDGVIYIVTGAGGAPRDSEYLHEHPELREPFTCKLVGDRHSFTLLDVEPGRVTLRQVDSNGVEIDRIVISHE
ncbi:MAG: metallophosphoesterase [Candidatus Melainabacteria bacterium]|nr:metallophosphoesterase [Candidatus Melainabacteria bacterium]